MPREKRHVARETPRIWRIANDTVIAFRRTKRKKKKIPCQLRNANHSGVVVARVSLFINYGKHGSVCARLPSSYLSFVGKTPESRSLTFGRISLVREIILYRVWDKEIPDHPTKDNPSSL